MSSPFTLNVDDLPDTIQMEMIELQSSDELRGRFQLASSPLEFFRRHVERSEFPVISAHVRRITAIFGSTYVCEQLFSKMKYAKNRLRSQLTDENLNNTLLLATSSLSPDFEAMCASRPHPVVSH